jgi:hypothetical protein
MSQITPSPPIWILAKRRLLGVAILALLGTVLLAGSAHAAPVAEPVGEASSQAVAAESVAAEPAPEASSPAEPVAEPGSETSPETSSPAPVTEPAEEASPAAGTEPAGETSPSAAGTESTSEAPPSEEPVVELEPGPSPPASVVEPEQAPEVSPPASVVEPERAPEPSTPVPVVELQPEASTPLEPSTEVKEVPAVEPSKEVEEATEVPTFRPVLGQGVETLSSSPVDTPADVASPEVSSAPDGPLIETVPIVSGESQTSSATSSAYAATLARMIASQRAANFNRELGGLGMSLTDTAGGSDGPSLLSVSAAIIDDLPGGTASSTGATAGGRSGGSPGGSAPIGPPPGPAPSGTFGGAAGGGTGIALSGFPAFAGHLLLGAPIAMRRLRLSFQPWLTAFFVLIPERPG